MQLPAHIQKYGFTFEWDNQKIWELDIPTESIDIAQLEWILDMPFWSNNGNSWSLSAREFLQNPDLYPKHQKRFETADTSFPIDIMKNELGQWLILDGLHRLVKLVQLGHKYVKVRKVSRNLIHLIVK